VKTPARAILSILLIVAAAPPMRSQDAPRASPAPPAFGSSITVVTVPVFVTDGRGRAIAGLTAEDFEVEDDGKPMRLVGVREFDASVEGAPAPPDSHDSPAARRHFLLLFDLSFSGINGLVRSQKAALEFVTNKLAPTDLVSIATFSANHGVRMLVGFTGDRFQLRRAIRTLGVLQPDQHADPLGLAFDLRELGAAAADTVAEERGEFVADSLRAIQLRFERSQEAL
jgi:VWFA-related protein